MTVELLVVVLGLPICCSAAAGTVGGSPDRQMSLFVSFQDTNNMTINQCSEVWYACGASYITIRDDKRVDLLTTQWSVVIQGFVILSNDQLLTPVKERQLIDFH